MVMGSGLFQLALYYPKPAALFEYLAQDKADHANNKGS